MSITVVSIWCQLTVEYWSLLFSIDIYTLGGNAFGAPCVFPFKHQGKWYAECIPRKNDAQSLWCATSSDFDKDQLFGNCPLKGNLFIKISGKVLSKSVICCRGQNVVGGVKVALARELNCGSPSSQWNKEMRHLLFTLTVLQCPRDWYLQGLFWGWWLGLMDKRRGNP